MYVSEVILTEYSDKVRLAAVYTGDKNSEDNTYSKATPSASVEMQIDNPSARGQMKPGQRFYVDFTPAE